MATKLPPIYRKSAEAVATFGYTDLVSGLGYNPFYLIQSKITSGGTIGRHLITTEDHSAVVEDNITTGTDVDFDSSVFNLTRTIKGTAYLWGSIESGGGGATSWVSFQLFKVSGGAETPITSELTTQRTVSDNFPLFTMIPMDCTQTTLNVGDFLRLTVKGVAAAGKAAYIGTDPLDGDGTTMVPSTAVNGPVTTITRINIPFRIDIL